MNDQLNKEPTEIDELVGTDLMIVNPLLEWDKNVTFPVIDVGHRDKKANPNYITLPLTDWLDIFLPGKSCIIG